MYTKSAVIPPSGVPIEQLYGATSYSFSKGSTTFSVAFLITELGALKDSKCPSQPIEDISSNKMLAAFNSSSEPLILTKPIFFSSSNSLSALIFIIFPPLFVHINILY